MRSLIEDRFSSLRFASLRIIQICLAAGVAWLIATRVVGHYEPFFAPISVVLVLGLAIEQRGRRAYEIAFGVALGIAIADLIVLALGTGTWQLMLVIGLAMSAAVLSGGGVMLVNQAAISGVLVATLPAPDLADTTHRFVDALVGGGVALAANAITPVDPVRLVRRYLEPLLARLSGTLVDIADALDHESHEEIVAALERARSLDPAVREMKIAVEAGQETISLAPTRRRKRGRVDQLAAAAEPIDLMIRNTRVLARACQRAIDLDEHIPPVVADSIRDLATSVSRLDRHLGGAPVRSTAREAALRAAAKATAALEETSNLSVSVIVGQIRSAATDLLLGLGMTNDQALDQVRSAREKLGI
ncbi:MAG TPA: FUSC family protein [Solirubrobacterales bacterium]|nr:FUSC family protein [Solirubrobacterales bacterium]HMX71467.1 FUSC family protein [Solirubrobacterales bacterium]HMY27021.1 FUSC family protein [Solirubrobacterales bacterium]HNA23794.1 FUSC family protein [Solirubrobacterales bacterium]HNA43444.1 FUSC family protein [Solirubrobacterales bacterium]